MATKNEPYAGTQAVLRALSLLDIFSDKQPEWNLAELTKAVDLNRTTLYRLLTALESAHIIVRDPETERYRLGSGAIVLGGQAIRANPVRAVSQPQLEKLAAATGETASLEILSGSEIVVIDEVSVDRLMSGTQAIGTRWPAHATSTGQAIMSHLPAAKLEALLQNPLPPITPQTITSPHILRHSLAQIREDGYAISAGALEIGYTDIGAPIRNYDDQPIAAISVGGPTARLTASRLPQIGALLRHAATHISTQLGWRP